MDNLHIVNLSSYNKPKIKEDKQRDWVNYGQNNDFYSYLIDLYVESTTNNAIINGVSQMIYGKGLDALDSSTKTEEYAALKGIFNNTCLRKIAFDLKLIGEASFQVIYKDGRVAKAEHFPRQTLRAEKTNEDGEIEAYYYYHDWSKIKPKDKPKRIAAFGYGNGSEPEIKIIKRYLTGYDYYCPPDYMGGLAYAELESEVADYLINDVQNGFSGTKVVNFNNGVPDREKQLQIKSDVMRKLTGARGEKVIIAFNNNAESKTTVDDIPLTDAPQHYEYLSNECIGKLMVAHRITSPLLLGIRDGNNGLGNNADEIKTASLLFHNTTIKPYQDLITDAMDDILAVNGIALKLYFKTLQPLEFIETDNAITDEAREEETGVKMASQAPEFDDNKMFDLLDEFGEEENLDEWELVDERAVDYEQEEALDKMIGLASTGTARPNAKSDLDGETKSEKRFIVRYQYAPLAVSNNSREFCRKMVAARKIYRKEDILSMGERAVNAGWGKGGADTYSIWLTKNFHNPLIINKLQKLYKGGGGCHHYWMRKTYLAK
ncbi:MAG: putative portal protein, partial [Prokaryotic dsDNA virus sp.]